ncbi:low molecular weight protein-tyrosine-phosphatase [Corynebacterium pseudopelargi]|uniref:protein-tyrosine-phosphatase n=1 Tax=Corynebacterium pseudopelargi TaxID=2080757 RepID=A0A3G6IT58_9CORY|nr:low molecular weight protein-tyrosine-phosphatase [Corynebacterium pseudopelargi]AZA08849.1 putative low molecular weight protein-tyrosine-phosphatase [Corynebacterium pseudopelargi]
MASSTEQLSVVFVCTGNICRSPMADVILQDAVEAENLADHVTVSSCGTGGWHIGQGADRRAIQALRQKGYDGTKHRAQQIGQEAEDADLLIALDQGHEKALQQLGYPKERIRLLRSFDPQADTLDVEDPYYGDAEDFRTARDQILDATPGIITWIKEQLSEQH